MRVVLALDSSQNGIHLCLSCAAGRYSVQKDDFRASSGLMSTCLDLFKRAQLEVVDLQDLLVGSGPGSFTGLRVGFSFLKGLAFSLQIPLHTISSFAAVALLNCTDKSSCVVLSDARRSECFVGIYQKSAAHLHVLDHPKIVAIKDLSMHLLKFSTALDQLKIINLSAELDSKLGGMLSVAPRANFAEGLIDYFLMQPSQDYSDTKLGALQQALSLSRCEPDYIRQVAARTIAERLSPP